MNFKDNKKMNRRDMLKLAGLAGLGMAIPAGLQAAVAGGGDDIPLADQKLPQVLDQYCQILLHALYKVQYVVHHLSNTHLISIISLNCVKYSHNFEI